MTWLFSTAVKKGLSRLVQYVIVLITTGKVAEQLASAGFVVTVDPIVATSATLGAYEVIRNWLKHKLGLKFL